MKILVAGNSVSEPPSKGAASYPALLSQRFGGAASVETIIGSGETIAQMETRIVESLARRPDWLILQVGINECAPRPLSVAERARLGALQPQWLQWRIVRLIHHLRPWIIRMRTLQQFMPLPDFLSSVRRVLAAAEAHGVRVIVLPITTVTSVAERRTPFTNREVARYNAALAGMAGHNVRVITQQDIFGSDDAAAVVASPDTVHLSLSAHERLADFLFIATASARFPAVSR